jgi:hypothetical protein
MKSSLPAIWRASYKAWQRYTRQAARRALVKILDLLKVTKI